MKTVIIIQGRMGSSRLSGKIMKNLCGRTVLAHDIERLRQVKQADLIIAATTVNPSDHPIALEAGRCGTAVYRGSEEDVLERYYGAAKESGAEAVIRVTSDCPLIDPLIIDDMITIFHKGGIDYMTNQSHMIAERTYPRGLDAEIFTFEALEQAYKSADQRYQREHVTPYLYENCSRLYYYKSEINYSGYRWTLDTEEDWNLIERIYGYLYHGKHDFYLKEILELIQEHPELTQINNMIEQKKLKD